MTMKINFVFLLAKSAKSMGPAHHGESMAISISSKSMFNTDWLLIYVSLGYSKKVLYGWFGQNWPSLRCMDRSIHGVYHGNCTTLRENEKYSSGN